MAAKGSVLKQEVAQKILAAFPGSFLYNDGKEIRIPVMENGEEIQIKVALTAAKENVNPGEDNLLPGENTTRVNDNGQIEFVHKVSAAETKVVEPTQEEKQNVQDLLRAIGL